MSLYKQIREIGELANRCDLIETLHHYEKCLTFSRNETDRISFKQKIHDLKKKLSE